MNRFTNQAAVGRFTERLLADAEFAAFGAAHLQSASSPLTQTAATLQAGVPLG
ncbi:MAG: hypothetical protein ACKVVT_13035 [Dehalococcoidia bacterium]